MNSFISMVLDIFKPASILDIAIIAIVGYNLYKMIKGTRAVQLLKGIAILLVLSFVSEFLGLTTVNWLLVKFQTVLFIAIPIIFQPELRRALEKIGTGSIWRVFKKTEDTPQNVMANANQIIRCMTYAAKNKTGVLIAIKRQMALGEFVDTGIEIGGKLTAELLGNIFIVNTPLHDGAVIIDGDKIVAASCYLPLSDSNKLSKELGTRHRAAVGLTEVTDAVVVVVSEETGAMSIADGGVLIRDVREQKLRELLLRKLQEPEKPVNKLIGKWGRTHERK